MSGVVPGRANKFNVVEGIYPQVSDTKAGWLSKPYVIPIANVFLIEKDTGKVKLSNGIHAYQELPYLIDANITDSQRLLLENYNQANGVLVLDHEGRINEGFLPRLFRGAIKTVSTYAEMVQRGEDPTDGEVFKNGAVIVIDASGDPSGLVQEGGAYYAWYDPDGEGDLSPGWHKVSEFKEPDVSLVNYFKYRGEGSQSIGAIFDDVDTTGEAPDKYLKFSYAEHSKLASVEFGADVTDYDNVQAAGAIMYNHAIISKELNAAGLEELLLRNIEQIPPEEVPV